jgi:hypothetical protein
MELRSIFKLKTKSGHEALDAVKSAIQKYARRGIRMKMLEAVTEMDSFSEFETTPSKAIRTNMINRLKVILFEDVSFSQINAFITVIEKIKEWEEEGRTDNNTLAEIVAVIADAKKLRLPSYLRAMYGKQEECSIDKAAFLSGIDNQKIECMEWIYHNDEEALKMLSERNFPGKEHVLPLITAEWKRLKPTKSKAGSNERFLFVIVPWLWIMYESDAEFNECAGTNNKSFTKKEIIMAYKSTNVMFDDYVYDVHTKEGKKKGKTVEEFRQNGSFVTNEDEVWLDKFEELKQHYINQPAEIKQKKKAAPKKKETKKRLRRGTIKTDNIKDSNINVEDIELITDGVCGNKLPCGFISIAGRDKVIKPMPKSLNYGMDYLYIDKQKRLFGLNELNIKLRRIPGKKLKVKRTKESKTYEWDDEEEGQIIAIMNKINVKNDLGKCKSLLKDKDKYREMLKIRLFNGLFRSSDNIIRNILVDDDDKLWAIDENDMFGKRKHVFNKKETIKQSPFFTGALIKSVIEELDFATHKDTLINELSKYFPHTSCEFYSQELQQRIANYKDIVFEELGLIDESDDESESDESESDESESDESESDESESDCWAKFHTPYLDFWAKLSLDYGQNSIPRGVWNDL